MIYMKKNARTSQRGEWLSAKPWIDLDNFESGVAIFLMGLLSGLDWLLGPPSSPLCW